MYVRRVHDETLEFGHRGWLLDESFIFFDRQYDSLWVQATGRCISGKFKGEQLATLPATHTTWGEWRALHPETLVLAKPPHKIEQYKRDSYERYYQRQRTKFGLAVFTDESQKLFPLDEFRDRPIIHDILDGQSLLLIFHAPSQTAVAFNPTIDGERRAFELVEVTDSDVLIRDSATHTIFSGLTGRPVAGDDPIPQLRQYRSTQFVISNWPKHFPGSPIFGRP